MAFRNASSVTLTQNPPGLPQLGTPVAEWSQNITFNVLTKSVVNFLNVETVATVNFRGVVQPLSPQALLIKPEGQRAWTWLQIHSLNSLILKPDDIITYEGQDYRVMSKIDDSKYGYVEYHVCTGYQNAP